MGENSFFRQTAALFHIPSSIIEQADKCEIWVTSFKDSGEDKSEYRFFKNDKMFDTITVKGY